MKKINAIKYLAVVLATVTLVSCNWVKEPTPGTATLKDYFTSGTACIYNVNANYVPLSYGYNRSYYYEWYFGDIMSDDALKGGDGVTDGLDALDIDNFNININNNIVLDFYQAQYQGIGRCNMSLASIPAVECDSVMTQDVKDRLIGESLFLRGYYYFRLVRLFGGVPIVTIVQNDDTKWHPSRNSKEEVYSQIISDLDSASQLLWNKSKVVSYEKAKGTLEVGRATKGAALAMLMKVNLYKGDYAKAKYWGDKFIETQNGEYGLETNYKDLFTLEHENGIESIFEIQYAEEATSDYGSGNGCTRGTFTQILTRPRNTAIGGWGWNKPTNDLFAEFEEGDIRRDATILVPDYGGVDDSDEYLGTVYNNRKSGWYNVDDNNAPKLAHQSRGPLNKPEIRYADFLLMYAEACAMSGSGNAATYLNMVRQRVGMPEFGKYQLKINGEMVSPDIMQAIKHERRVELAMEGHRWFDLLRWGTAKEVMENYRKNETKEAQAEMKPWNDKFLLMPIPAEELKLNPNLNQNFGY
ncbi:MAG: RagB/SusD family nutrient uptake outer membrane protein [Paludibacteraceae bacterium]|nr:RagB/SusD family nutrient uptake outer membrane protein [Paludibacteraceae bacterium]